MKYILPYPPTINTYFATFKGRRILSAKGRKFKIETFQSIITQGRFFFEKERLSLTVEVYPPDKRRRDLDNILKPLQDALQFSGLFEDDSQIDVLRAERMHSFKDGKVEIELEAIK